MNGGMRVAGVFLYATFFQCNRINGKGSPESIIDSRTSFTLIVIKHDISDKEVEHLAIYFFYESLSCIHNERN